jgi:large subunit ribosomal protein L4
MADLNPSIFNLKVENHELVAKAYNAYLANARSAGASTKKRGEVRGGGRKPWRQKGTGRARIGSIRAPHWRGGGVTFGPTGDQNYTITVPKNAKRVAIKQALSLQNAEGLVKLIAGFSPKEGKTKEALEFLSKQKAEGNTLLVVENKNDLLNRSTQNLSNLKVVQSKYLNVYDILNADLILIESSAITVIEEWLIATPKEVAAVKVSKTKAPAAAKSEAKKK